MSKIRHKGTQSDLDAMASQAMIISDQLMRNQIPVVSIGWEDIFNLANSYLFLYNKTMEKGILPPPTERGNTMRIH